MDEATDRVFDLLAALVEVTAGAGYPRTSETIEAALDVLLEEQGLTTPRLAPPDALPPGIGAPANTPAAPPDRVALSFRSERRAEAARAFLARHGRA